MMNMQNQRVTAAFFMEGLRDVKEGYDAIITAWNQGCIEMVSALVGYVPMTEKLCDAAAAACDGCFPGVFDYEVSSSFGTWFGDYIIEHGDQPDQKEAHAWLIKEIGTFFCQGSKPEEQETIKQAIQMAYEGAKQ